MCLETESKWSALPTCCLPVLSSPFFTVCQLIAFHALYADPTALPVSLGSLSPHFAPMKWHVATPATCTWMTHYNAVHSEDAPTFPSIMKAAEGTSSHQEPCVLPSVTGMVATLTSWDDSANWTDPTHQMYNYSFHSFIIIYWLIFVNGKIILGHGILVSLIALFRGTLSYKFALSNMFC